MYLGRFVGYFLEMSRKCPENVPKYPGCPWKCQKNTNVLAIFTMRTPTDTSFMCVCVLLLWASKPMDTLVLFAIFALRTPKNTRFMCVFAILNISTNENTCVFVILHCVVLGAVWGISNQASHETSAWLEQLWSRHSHWASHRTAIGHQSSLSGVLYLVSFPEVVGTTPT